MLARLVLLFALILSNHMVLAATFEIRNIEDSVIGQNILLYSRPEDTLLDIGRQFDLGYSDIVDANPNVEPWLPGDKTPVIVPTRYILPDIERKGIVINLAEMRLYYFPKVKAGEIQRVVTHPIGIGREGWATPLGQARIVSKTKNPSWIPPESVKKEHAEAGDPLPNVVPAGPDNPLGAYKMRLSIPGYLLHGTNKPYGVGLRVSHGCIRLFPEDIESLFGMTKVNTPVEIIYAPEKAGIKHGQLYVEAHQPHDDVDKTSENNMTPMVSTVLKVYDKLPSTKQWLFMESVIQQQSGVVTAVTQPQEKTIQDLWFVHPGLSIQAIESTIQALGQLKLDELFWPLTTGAVGEFLIGPFSSMQEAEEISKQLSETAKVPLWVVQLPNDAI